MSSSPPSTTVVPVPGTSAPPSTTTSGALAPVLPGPPFPTTTSASAPSSVVYTPEQMSGVINDLVAAVQGIRLFLIGSQGPPTPPQPAAVTGPPWIPAVDAVTAANHHRPGPRRLERCPDPTCPLSPVAVTTSGVARRVVASTGLYDGRGPAAASPIGRHILGLRGLPRGPS
jgi:hypothetical protein